MQCGGRGRRSGFTTFCRVALGVAASLLLAAPLSAGPPTGTGQPGSAEAETKAPRGGDVFGERIEVSLVGLEVWVSDADGEPVTGLTADDFTVRHDGDPVAITHFSEVRPAAVPAQPVGTEATPADEAGADEVPAEPPPPLAVPPPGHLVVYFDQNRLSPGSYPRVAEALDEVLAEGVVPADRILVLRQAERLHLEVPFGSSAADVRAAVERVTSGSHRGLARASGLDQAREQLVAIWEWAEGLSGPRRRACNRFRLRAGPLLKAWTRERSADVGRTLTNLHAASSLLSGLPGVKAVVYVSDGLDLAPGEALAAYASEFCPELGRSWELEAMDEGMGRDFLRLAAHANARGVTLHAIQASGLRGLRQGSASQRATTTPMGSGVRFETRLRQTARSGMSLLATETGGRAVFNRGDLAPELAAIGRGLTHYYSLAFPPPEGSGPVHRVGVTVADPSLTVRYRRTIRTPDPDERFEEGLAGALHLGLVSNLHDLSLGVAEAGGGDAGEGGGPALNLLVMVPLERLLFAPEGAGAETGAGQGGAGAGQGAGFARVEVRALAVPLVPAGAAARSSAPPVRLAEEFRLRRPAGAAGSEVARQRATLRLALPVPPGPHRLAVALRDALSGETSFVITELTVPAPALQETAGDAPATP